MTTPTYRGQGQPLASNGWFGGLGSWLGGVSTPMYAGKGQPSAATSGYLAGSTPAYKPAPSKPSSAPTSSAPTGAGMTPSTAPSGAMPASAPTDPAMTPDDPSAMGFGPIAIVIPRDGFEP